jgi:hypothetical protein
MMFEPSTKSPVDGWRALQVPGGIVDGGPQLGAAGLSGKYYGVSSSIM